MTPAGNKSGEGKKELEKVRREYDRELFQLIRLQDKYLNSFWKRWKEPPNDR